MASQKVLQLIFVPHRPVKSEEEIQANLAEPLKILLGAKGLLSCWQGRKFEERSFLVYILIWEDLASSHAFFTSRSYEEFQKIVQPALNGRHITWTQHSLIGTSALDSIERFKSIIESPAIEVAWTKVVEGKVAGYYDQFSKVVVPILNADSGCDGFYISPQLENPQSQILLINWKSVDAHHVDFENRIGFRQCIDALFDYYGEFVVPWHITEVKPIFGSL